MHLCYKIYIIQTRSIVNAAELALCICIYVRIIFLSRATSRKEDNALILTRNGDLRFVRVFIFNLVPPAVAAEIINRLEGGGHISLCYFFQPHEKLQSPSL